MRWNPRLLPVLATLLLATTASATEPPFPLDDETRVDAGRRRFSRTCAAYCHGAEGSGGRAPAFKGNTQLAPEHAFKIITEGRRGAGIMPPFGNGLTPEQIWELVAYLQALSRMPPD
jgi:mono/diheme cytochrome c family protein